MRYLPLITSILFAVSIALMALFGSRSIWGRFAARAARDAEKFERWSVDLFLGWDAKKSLQIAYAANASVILAPLLTLMLSGSLIFAGGVAVAVYLLPEILLRRARHKRLARIDRQLPDAINVMVSSTRAGQSLSQSIDEVAAKVPGPIGQEFAIIANEVRQGGVTVENALARAKARIPVESFLMVTTALIINCSKGGDVLNILERLSDAIRELCRLKEKIYTETSEVRAQGKIILFMTPLFGVVVCMFDPEIRPILFDSLAGNIILVVVGGLQTISVVWIRRIIRTAI
ncbi:MAG: type II secretion system F family protein [Acidobacteria bacterium]|nr:type II secretion system F family protein [Acidobacteriota bacterium]